MSKQPLTEKQEKVYQFLVKCSGDGLPPTVREICAATGIKSTSSVHGILQVLEDAGYIERDARFSRAIKIGGAGDATFVPLVGKVTAGTPILAVEQIEDYIPYPTKDATGLFALKVSGLSMRDAGILDGDIIVGMDGEEATVKRLKIEKSGQVIFMPENPDFSPIYPAKPEVLGKVVGVYRKY